MAESQNCISSLPSAASAGWFVGIACLYTHLPKKDASQLLQVGSTWSKPWSFRALHGPFIFETLHSSPTIQTSRVIPTSTKSLSFGAYTSLAMVWSMCFSYLILYMQLEATGYSRKAWNSQGKDQASPSSDRLQQNPLTTNQRDPL